MFLSSAIIGEVGLGPFGAYGSIDMGSGAKNDTYEETNKSG